MITIGQFFGFEEDPRSPEGWFSPEQLIYVTVIVLISVLLAALIGKRYRSRSEREKKKPLRIAAAVMLTSEISKIVLITVRSSDPWIFRSNLPLFLCSIIFFTLPIAAFGKRRIAGAALSFTFAFGMLCCLAGTYLAANVYSNYPIFSFDSMASNLAHCIAGFSAVYIGTAGLAKREPGDLGIMAAILGIFEAAALTVDLLQTGTGYECNYMFFMRPDGTPFAICMDLVGGSLPLYAAFVAVLYFVYLFLFLIIWRFISEKGRTVPRRTTPE
ncbi:MAG: YwaF family protein [Clostridia bacterium]|nr:YwaF family protein [Clostridia bacterium]